MNLVYEEEEEEVVLGVAHFITVPMPVSLPHPCEDSSNMDIPAIRQQQQQQQGRVNH